MKRVRTGAVLLALLPGLLGSADAVGIKLRPQGEALQRAVEAALALLSTKDSPMTLDSSGGPTLTLGGVGVTNAAFNPDSAWRVVNVGGERRLEFNPNSKTPLLDAVKQALQAELKLKDWTPAAAQQRFSGADLNGDGVINVADLAIFMANYGSNTAAPGDLNQDRKVDDADWRIFSAQYTAAMNQPAPAPAPAVPPATVPATGTPTPTPPATTPPPATTDTPPVVAPPVNPPETPPATKP